MKPSTRAQIPVLFAFVLIVSFSAVVLMLLVAAITGRQADPVAETTLAGLASSSLAGLLFMWGRGIGSPPDPPEPPPAPEPERPTLAPPDLFEAPIVEESRRKLGDFLDKMRGGRRWMLPRP